MDNAELIPEVVTNPSESETGAAENPKPARKKFVTPEISVPVDVLEATTFFQQQPDSGVLP